MKVKLFSIFDLKSRVYLAPFVARSLVDAQRQIAASFRDPQMMQTPVGQNPEDFELHSVGDFDDETGDVSPSTTGFVCSLSTLRADISAPSTVAS